MGLTGILGFISLAGWIALLAGAGLAISNAAQNRSARGGISLAIFGLFVGVLFFVFSSGLVEVGPTQIAVVFQQLGGNAATKSLTDPLGPGVHIVIPIVNQVTIYSTEGRTYTMSKVSDEGQHLGDDAISARTSDGQQVDVDLSIQYAIDPAQVNQLHLLWQNRYESDFVRPTTRTAVYDATVAYTGADIYGAKRTDLQKQLFNDLKPRFTANGLVLRDVQLRQITFSDDFVKAVDAKKVAEQQALQADQEAIRARTLAKGQADAAVTKAQGDADASVAKAKGDAQAIELRAAADAKALALINEQLSKNPLLLQWRYIEKLAGDVRLVLLPSNSPFLFDVNKLAEGAGVPAVSSTPEPTTTPK
jgi:regulator of protease activity HflC (stomatin/prohibitin superfamily)